MHHLILGYGYCGYYLAQELIKNKQQVTVVSRHVNLNYQLPSVVHQTQDIATTPLIWEEEDTCLYYLIPPPAQNATDTLLQNVLQQNPMLVKKVIYFGSSGVYGNQQGTVVDEEAECQLQNPRQLSRLNAETQWRTYCTQHAIDLILLRIGGIFGPNRIPMAAAQQNTPIIVPQQAPLINHIYVRDLAHIASLLAQINTGSQLLNIADGTPRPMGTLQSSIAQKLDLTTYYQSWEDAWSSASLMKKEFLQGSKRLNINRLRNLLPSSFCFTPLERAIEESI
jgi:nucleoside-diphosphate-sugar epimerase